MKTMVWLKDDLRLHDSPAVLSALKETPVDHVVFVRTDEGRKSHVRPTERRLAAERAALDGMRRTLAPTGASLVEIGPDADEFHEEVRRSGITTIHANMQTSDDLGHRRDRDVARSARGAGVPLVEHAVDGVARGTGAKAGPCVTGARDVPGLRFEAVPDALARLRTYLDRLPQAHYRRDMWLPGPDALASSRLSVDLACGTLSGDRVLHEIERHAAAADPRDLHAFRQFSERIHWRRGFVQMLENGIQAFPWGPMREERKEDAERMRAWLAGETGYPLVDAAMRDLAASGWINFRLRQVVNSFAIDLLDLDLHKVGVALGELFDDYCPGIHWCQIALQSGMVAGRGPRIVNPLKQAAELDASGTYVRHMLPHMANVPAEHLHRPWEWHGYAGPEPIIDNMVAARVARAKYPSSRAAPSSAAST